MLIKSGLIIKANEPCNHSSKQNQSSVEGDEWAEIRWVISKKQCNGGAGCLYKHKLAVWGGSQQVIMCSILYIL